jgi:ABC-type branched-subunit amino acid transport system substrate-binding protein
MQTLVRRLLRHWPLLLMLVMVLSACKPAAAPGCPTIRIGVIFDTGDPASVSMQKAGYDAAVKDINQAGIGQGCQVEWVAPLAGQEVVTNNPQLDVQSLTGLGVVAIVAPPSDSIARQVASISRYFSIPVLIPADSGDEIIESGKNNWNFRINPASRDYASAAFALVQANRGSNVPSAAIFFEHSEYGESAAVAAGNAAMANNIAIAVYQRFSQFSEDFKDIQTLLLDKRPNVIFLISTRPKQAAAIVQAIKAAKDPTGKQLPLLYFFANGSAFTSPDFLYDSAGNLNSGVDGLILTLPWAGNSSRQDGKNCQLALPQTHPDDTNPLALNTVQAYVSLRTIANAVQQLTAGQTWTVNEKKITDWMEMFNGPENLVAFRQTLAEKIRSSSACLYGNYLWPVQFNTDGQNILTPVLVKANAGNLVQVSPLK